MKKLVSVLIGAGLFFGSQVFAQNRTATTVKIDVTNNDISVYETQRDNLATIISITDNLRFQETIGLLPPCSTEQVVYGLAAGLAKRQTEVAPGTPAEFAAEIANLGAQVHSIVVAAVAAEECAPPAKNDKCCKKGATADTSDSCDPATNKYCKLTGIQIKGCVDTSDDC